ncbi:MAG: uracil-xanthine permease family protein [Xanthobacteraceae bacterium]
MDDARAYARLPRILTKLLDAEPWLRFLRDTRPTGKSKRPADLVHGLDDVPPPIVTGLVGLQHVSLVRIQLIYPAVVLQMAELPAVTSVNLLCLAMIALGLASILQSLPRGPIGSGFLCPSCHTGIFLEPSLAAMKLGGLPLVFGMTIMAGVLQSALSPMLRRIRPLLPPEIGGLVVFLVGTSIAAIGCRYLIGVGAKEPVSREYWLVGGLTLATTVALNVWGKGQVRLFCALIGMMVGSAAAVATGLLPTTAFHALADLSWVAIPHFAHNGWSFSPAMILPFTVATLAITLKNIGDITACQRINDAGWVRADMGSISRGTLANGLANIFAGLIGTLGLTPSTASIGLQAATAVSSRVIGLAVGLILIAFAFLPALTGSLVLMPRPVMGAMLLFSACFVLISGLQTITSRMLDARRTIVIGLAIASGIAAEIIPTYATDIPAAIEPIVSSSIVLGTVAALLLNGLFLVGQRQRVTLAVEPEMADSAAQVEEFFDAAGRRWGARADVMVRVAFGIKQAVETIREHCDPQGPIAVEARFDEFNLDVRITYRGAPLEFPDQRPSSLDIIETDSGHLRLAGFLLRQNADRVRTWAKDGASVLEFHFEH